MWESYEAAYVSYFADKAAIATANLSSVLPCSLSPHKRCPRRGIPTLFDIHETLE